VTIRSRRGTARCYKGTRDGGNCRDPHGPRRVLRGGGRDPREPRLSSSRCRAPKARAEPRGTAVPSSCAPAPRIAVAERDGEPDLDSPQGQWEAEGLRARVMVTRTPLRGKGDRTTAGLPASERPRKARESPSGSPHMTRTDLHGGARREGGHTSWVVPFQWMRSRKMTSSEFTV